jgi:diguanylate cyclase (GGDEF)-like protein
MDSATSPHVTLRPERAPYLRPLSSGGRYSLSGAGDVPRTPDPAVPSLVFAAALPRRVILVVGMQLAEELAQKLTRSGFTISYVETPPEARAFIGDRMPVAILLRPSTHGDAYPLVRWVREQERLAFVQVFVSPAGATVATAICAGADDVFDTLDVDAAERMTARINRAHVLAQLALLDPLTQLHNRRFMNHRLQAEVARAVRARTAFSIALIDLDDFKHINDTFGHAAGDHALVAFAHALRRDLRAYDVPCRFGGDEFVVLFPDCDGAGANAALAKLRDRCGWSVSGLPVVTFSAGIAQFPNDGETWEELFNVADRHTLEAKAAGRNRTMGNLMLSAE